MEVLAQAAAPLMDGRERMAEMEKEWVDRARSGDQEAFGELVRMHRAKALGLAGSLMKDSYLAEDVVQEALIRAFLHLGSLTDNSRFAAWLQRIVRNQAYMKLRRGGPYGNERPFQSFAGGTQEQSGNGADAEAVDWCNIDSILFHLAGQAQEASRNSSNPEQCLIRKETLQGIHMLIRCLNKRERDIFLRRSLRCSAQRQPASTIRFRGPARSCRKNESAFRSACTWNGERRSGCRAERYWHLPPIDESEE
jgi:RNA polymerase sigma factor (sigma-70 family)